MPDYSFSEDALVFAKTKIFKVDLDLESFRDWLSFETEIEIEISLMVMGKVLIFEIIASRASLQS